MQQCQIDECVVVFEKLHQDKLNDIWHDRRKGVEDGVALVEDGAALVEDGSGVRKDVRK